MTPDLITPLIGALVTLLTAERGYQVLRMRRNGNRSLTQDDLTGIKSDLETVKSGLETVKSDLKTVKGGLTTLNASFERHMGQHEGLK